MQIKPIKTDYKADYPSEKEVKDIDILRTNKPKSWNKIVLISIAAIITAACSNENKPLPVNPKSNISTEVNHEQNINKIPDTTKANNDIKIHTEIKTVIDSFETAGIPNPSYLEIIEYKVQNILNEEASLIFLNEYYYKKLPDSLNKSILRFTCYGDAKHVLISIIFFRYNNQLNCTISESIFSPSKDLCNEYPNDTIYNFTETESKDPNFSDTLKSVIKNFINTLQNKQ